MPFYMAAFAAPLSEAIEKELPKLGGIRMWPGCWIFEFESFDIATRRLVCLRWAAGHMLVEIDPERLDTVVAAAVSDDGRIAFQEQLAPALFEARPECLRG